MLICNRCQSIFKPPRTNKNNPQKFCSNACTREAHKSIKQPRPCIHCRCDTLNPKFCNSSCAATYNNTMLPKRKKKLKVKICATCSALCDKKYCSTACNPHRLQMSAEEKILYTKAKKNEAWARYM